MNEKLSASMNHDEDKLCMMLYPGGPESRRKIWQELVSTKKTRMGPNMGFPEDLYVTRFRTVNSPDPRSIPD
jgi:hypothetical protein